EPRAGREIFRELGRPHRRLIHVVEGGRKKSARRGRPSRPALHPGKAAVLDDLPDDERRAADKGEELRHEGEPEQGSEESPCAPATMRMAASAAPGGFPNVSPAASRGVTPPAELVRRRDFDLRLVKEAKRSKRLARRRYAATDFLRKAWYTIRTSTAPTIAPRS